MKRIFQVLFLALIAIGYTACQPDSFREVYPKGNPTVEAHMLTNEVLFGSDSISFEVKIIFLPFIPLFCDKTISGIEAQSVPQPSSFKRRSIAGVGVAFTAKYSLKPLFHENAAFSARALRRMPASSYRWKGVGIWSMISLAFSKVRKDVFFIYLSPLFS